MAGEVTLRCKRTTASTRGVEPGKVYHPSALDRVMELNVLRVIYYYELPREDGKDGALTSKLRESFAEVLSSFPVAAGRLQTTAEGHWAVKCNDAGVRMIEARAKGSIEEWLRTADSVQELKLTYWEAMYETPYFWSTFYVQVTEFEGGGLSIGLSCSHLLADAECATALIKAWADTHLLGNILSPPYFHPLPPRRRLHHHPAARGDQDPSMPLIEHYKLAIEKKSLVSVSTPETPAARSVSFSFSDDMVRRCMADFSSTTPFEALAALFWTSISLVKGRDDGLVSMSVCLDVRRKLGLSKEFFGNAMVFGEVHQEGVEVGRVDKAAKAVADAVRKISYEKVMDLIEWLDSNKDMVKPAARPIMPHGCGCQLLCANWEGLGCYEAMFDSGVVPVRVSCYLDPAIGGQVLVLPSPQRQGSASRVVMVTLPVDQVVKLCEETTVLRFRPTILMKAGKTHL